MSLYSITRYTPLKNEDGGLTEVTTDVRDHQKAVFDHLFYKAPNKFNEVEQNFNGVSK